MTHGDLFSGIGGFALAARWMGWRTAWFSEVEPFACATLAHHWPDVPNLGDVRAVRWHDAPRVDVLTGGFPCQPHSLAGKRAGSNDERDLFDEIIRCAGVLRPRTIVLENVPGLFTSDAGRFFGRVLGALAAIGYDAEWRVLSAADVGAPHKRERVWIVADRNSRGQQERAERDGGSTHRPADRDSRGGDIDGRRGYVGDTDDARSQGLRRPVKLNGAEGRHPEGRHRSTASDAMGWADAVPVRGHDGTVRLIPRAAAAGGPESPLWPVAYGVPGRVARLRGIGNAIVPAVALEIFRDVAARLTVERAA
jgi:DNA (cytosine-5)-methyltransferase 1